MVAGRAGWKHESYRHGLAAKGIKTKPYLSKKVPMLYEAKRAPLGRITAKGARKGVKEAPPELIQDKIQMRKTNMMMDRLRIGMLRDSNDEIDRKRYELLAGEDGFLNQSAYVQKRRELLRFLRDGIPPDDLAEAYAGQVTLIDENGKEFAFPANRFVGINDFKNARLLEGGIDSGDKISIQLTQEFLRRELLTPEMIAKFPEEAQMAQAYIDATNELLRIDGDRSLSPDEKPRMLVAQAKEFSKTLRNRMLEVQNEDDVLQVQKNYLMWAPTSFDESRIKQEGVLTKDELELLFNPVRSVTAAKIASAGIMRPDQFRDTLKKVAVSTNRLEMYDQKFSSLRNRELELLGPVAGDERQLSREKQAELVKLRGEMGQIASLAKMENSRRLYYAEQVRADQRKVAGLFPKASREEVASIIDSAYRDAENINRAAVKLAVNEKLTRSKMLGTYDTIDNPRRAASLLERYVPGIRDMLSENEVVLANKSDVQILANVLQQYRAVGRNVPDPKGLMQLPSRALLPPEMLQQVPPEVRRDFQRIKEEKDLAKSKIAQMRKAALFYAPELRFTRLRPDDVAFISANWQQIAARKNVAPTPENLKKHLNEIQALNQMSTVKPTIFGNLSKDLGFVFGGGDRKYDRFVKGAERTQDELLSLFTKDKSVPGRDRLSSVVAERPKVEKTFWELPLVRGGVTSMLKYEDPKTGRKVSFQYGGATVNFDKEGEVVTYDVPAPLKSKYGDKMVFRDIDAFEAVVLEHRDEIRQMIRAQRPRAAVKKLAAPTAVLSEADEATIRRSWQGPPDRLEEHIASIKAGFGGIYAQGAKKRFVEGQLVKPAVPRMVSVTRDVLVPVKTAVGIINLPQRRRVMVPVEEAGPEYERRRQQRMTAQQLARQKKRQETQASQAVGEQELQEQRARLTSYLKSPEYLGSLAGEVERKGQAEVERMRASADLLRADAAAMRELVELAERKRLEYARAAEAARQGQLTSGGQMPKLPGVQVIQEQVLSKRGIWGPKKTSDIGVSDVKFKDEMNASKSPVFRHYMARRS